MKPTKGPWNIQVNASDEICVWRGANRVAKIDHFPHEGATANAYLIAAAPDLLEALKIMTELVGAHLSSSADHSDESLKVMWAEYDLAKQAIAKAEGRES